MGKVDVIHTYNTLTLLMPNLVYFPILILKITYLNFPVAGILLLIILRSVKLFSFICNSLINIVIPIVHYVFNLVGGSHR